MNISFMEFRRLISFICRVSVILLLQAVILLSCASTETASVKSSAVPGFENSDSICIVRASSEKAETSDSAFVNVVGFYPPDAPDSVVSAVPAFTDGIDIILSESLSSETRNIIAKNIPEADVAVNETAVCAADFAVFLCASGLYCDENVECEPETTVMEYDRSGDSYSFTLVTKAGFDFTCRIQDLKSGKTVFEMTEPVSIRERSLLGFTDEDGNYSGSGVFSVRESPESLMHILSVKAAGILESALF